MRELDRAALVEWRLEVRRAIQFIAERQPTLTSDDIWAAIEGEREGFEPRPLAVLGRRQSLGSIMRAAANAGVLERTGLVQQSRRAMRHYGSVAIWRSRLYQAVLEP